ncbi:MAG TPA: hypothetical protein VFO07_00530 [Roseiflexaceae bacterium]|nr:hypothetical protein [Roseiflexaceae bacterium]
MSYRISTTDDRRPTNDSGPEPRTENPELVMHDPVPNPQLPTPNP